MSHAKLNDTEAAVIAATWAALDATIVHGNLITASEAARMFRLSTAHFQTMSRDEGHILADLLIPALWHVRSSGMRYGQLWWRHRIAIAAYVYLYRVDRKGGPYEWDVDPSVVRDAKRYTTEYVGGAVSLLTRADDTAWTTEPAEKRPTN